MIVMILIDCFWRQIRDGKVVDRRWVLDARIIRFTLFLDIKINSSIKFTMLSLKKKHAGSSILAINSIWIFLLNTVWININSNLFLKLAMFNLKFGDSLQFSAFVMVPKGAWI